MGTSLGLGLGLGLGLELGLGLVDGHLVAEHRERLGGEAQVVVEAALAARVREALNLLHHLPAWECGRGCPQRGGPAGAEVARDRGEAVEPLSAQPG